MAKKNLLVAVDFGDASNLVVQKADALAQQFSARIVLLHVVDPTVAYASGGWHRERRRCLAFADTEKLRAT